MKAIPPFKSAMIHVLASAALLFASTGNAQTKDVVKLQFSDGRSNVAGIDNVNYVLHSIGVHASTLPVPAAADPILQASQTRAMTKDEQRQLISIFSLDRRQLLEQVQLAGRTPVAPRGGYLTTTELDTPPYPKVYDMKALTPAVHNEVLKKYGRLHVNSSDNGMGIDEVMTVVSGGPFTWVFVLPDGVLARLTVEQIGPNDPAVRLSYPGLGMHAGYMDPQQGVIVAFAHGPENFVMRYEDPSVPHSELLGTNAWVDFSGDMPRLRNRVN